MRFKELIKFFLPLLFIIPVFVFRDYTTDNELKYISIIREALADRNYFTFYNHDEIYADKPPLYFWLLMLLRLFTGVDNMLIYGMATLIPAYIIIITMNRLSFGKNNKAEFTPMLMLISTVMFLGSTVALRMDILMVMFIVLALSAFFRMYCGEENNLDQYLLPLYIFLAVFSKGAVGIIIPVFSILVFLLVEKQVSSIKKYLGWKQWLIIFCLTSIWFTGVFLEGGFDYIYNLLVKQTIGRGINSFHHKRPFYYYLITSWYSLAPWIFLSVITLFKGFKTGIIHSDIKLKFYSVIVITTFIIMSLVSSKLDIYLLPLYPFIIYLTYMLLEKIHCDWWIKISVIIVSVPFLAMPLIYPHLKENLSVLKETDLITTIFIRATILIMCIGGAISSFLCFKDKISKACVSLASAILFSITVVSFIIPHFNSMIDMKELYDNAIAISKNNACTGYAFFRYRGYEQMDVFIGEDLIKVSNVSEFNEQNSNNILFIRQLDYDRNAQLREYIGNNIPVYKKGKHNIYLIKK